jgi:phosphoglycolate phosphatase
VDYEGVIFDLDGTLADTLEDLGDALDRVLGAHGFPAHSYAEYRQLIGRGIRNLVSEAMPPGERSDQAVATCYEQMLADYGENCLVRTRLYDGIPEMLSALRAAGVRLAVLSNKADDLTRRIVAALSAPGTFAVVVGAQPGQPLKPDPAGALEIGRRLGVTPGRIVHVGDSGTDMRTAVAAGMFPVGVSWGFRSRAELVENGARVVLDRPAELLALMR